MEVIAPEHEVIKPENDLKEYKFVELPNKVQAFLISTKKHLEHFQKDNKFATQANPSASGKPELEESPESPDSPGDEDDDEDYEDEIDEEDDDEFDINEADAQKFIAAAMELESNNAKAPAAPGKDKKGLASVSVTVGAGSCDEPSDYPGLAHLLEHIISLGSKEFPEEDAFSKFISRHGGFENAFTSFNSTTYEFDIDNKYLSEALYRFSRLLKEPLLRQTGIAKEVKAIDNEFELAAVDEDIQRFQVILSNFPKGFPLNTFPWGNAKSLQQKEEILQAETEKFYKAFYRNDAIKVCVHANYNLQELEEMFSKCFSDIGPGHREPETEPKEVPSLADVKKSFAGGFYFLKSTSKIQKLTFTWVIDTLIREYKVLPLDLILGLLNERSSGSLYQRLMDENLITDLGAELEDIDGQINEYLYMPFLWLKLTDKGMQNINLIIQYTGEYLNMLNSNVLPDYYLNEAKTISQYEFRYADEVAEEDLTNVISQGMKYIPYQQLLQSGIYRVFLKEDKAMVAKVLSELAIKSARIDIQAPELPAILKDAKVNQIVDYEYEEHYFGTKYTKLDIKEIVSPQVLNQIFEKGTYSETFTFPERNELIPEALKLHDINQDFVLPTKVTSHQNLVNQDNWFKVDTEFRIPKASIQFLVCFNLKRDFASNVYLELVENYLLEIFFQGIGNKARKAGFECNIEKHEYFSLEITIYGFSGKIINLSKMILDFLFSTLKEIKDDVFGQIVEKRTKFYEKALDDPERYLKIALIRYLYDFGRMPEEKIEFLKNPELNSNFKAFCSRLVQSGSIRKIKTYAHGNLLQEDLSELYTTLHNHIETKLLLESSNKEKTTSSVDSLFIDATTPISSGLRRFPQEIPSAQLISHIKKQKNNLSLYYLDLGEDTLENRVLCQLLNQIFNTELFESLRMKQQIGYIANSYPIVLSSLRVGLEIWVSSSKLNASEITQKILEFVKWFIEEFLPKYDEKEFDDLRQSEISIKTKPFHSIQDAALDFWSEIKYNTLLTNRRQQEIQYLNQLNFKYFKDWTNNVFANSKRLSLELQASDFKPKEKEGGDAMEEESMEGEEEDYEDIEEEEEEEPEEEEEEEDNGEISEEAKQAFNLLFEQNLQKLKQNIVNLQEVYNVQLD